MEKISIRFFNDREVRAIWDEENSKWWFSVLDIVGVLNDQIGTHDILPAHPPLRRTTPACSP